MSVTKYLDERLTATVEQKITETGTYQYEVSYCPSNDTRKTIFYGNIYLDDVSAESKTIDITDIVHSHIATLNIYGQELEYMVRLITMVDNSKSVKVYNIWRYPHSLTTWANYVGYHYKDDKYIGYNDLYYTGFDNSTRTLMLVPTYPAIATNELKKEWYLFRNKAIIDYTGTNKQSDNSKLGTQEVQTLWYDPENVSIPDNTNVQFSDDAVVYQTFTPYKPTRLSGYLSGTDPEGEVYIEEEITSFPYTYTDNITQKKSESSYIIDLYIGDSDDETRYNYYPDFYQGDGEPARDLYEQVDINIKQMDSTVTENIWEVDEFDIYGDTIELDWQKTDQDWGNCAWFDMRVFNENGTQILEETALTNYSLKCPFDYNVKDLYHFQFTFYRSDGATIEQMVQDINMSYEFRNKIMTYDINLTPATASTVGRFTMTANDSQYEILTKFTGTITRALPQTDVYMSPTFTYTEEIILPIFEEGSNDFKEGDAIYTFDSGTNYLEWVRIEVFTPYKNLVKSLTLGQNYGQYTLFSYLGIGTKKLQVYVTYKVNNRKYGSWFKLDFDSDVFFSFEGVQIKAYQGTNNTYRYMLNLRGYRIYPDGRLVYDFKLGKLKLNSTNRKLLQVTCPKGLFLQWRDRFGSLQCQPFNNMTTYGEDISTEELTTYYGKRQKYLTTVQPKFKINSGWIDTDKYPCYEGIFVSKTLTLYDADTDTAYDVLITNKEYTEKTFQNQQHRQFNLALDLEVSEKQNMLQ